MRSKKKRPNKNLGPGELPERLRWRPRFRLLGFVSGLIGGLGAVILVAQYGVAPLSRALSIQGLFGAVLSGLLVPSAVFALVVRFHNRRLDAALARVEPGRSPGAGVMALVAMAVAFAAPFYDTGSAAAEVSGQCGGDLNGIDLGDVDASAADAFVIVDGDTVTGSMFIDRPVTGGQAGISMFGIDFAFDLEPSNDTPGREEFEFEYDDISWLGSGLMELWVDADLEGGGSCEIRFMINIDGNPLETVVGQVAAGAVGVGAVGMTISGAGAVLEGGRVMGDLRRGLGQLATLETPADVDLAAFEVTGVGNASVVVEPGDNLWTLSETELEGRLGRSPTDAETRVFWQSVIDANADTLQSGDPDLIYPGETISFPADGVDAGVTDAAPETVAATPETATSPPEPNPAAEPPSATAEPAVGEASTSAAEPGGVEAGGPDGEPASTEAGSGAAEPRPVVAETITVDTDAAPTLNAAALAGVAGLGAVAALGPARYLLLARLEDPDSIDPRLEVEVDRVMAELGFDDLDREVVVQAANGRLGEAIAGLADDFVNPPGAGDVSSWPPRVGTAVAWMYVADSPPLSAEDLAAACTSSMYLESIQAGQARSIVALERKAAWPWT